MSEASKTPEDIEEAIVDCWQKGCALEEITDWELVADSLEALVHSVASRLTEALDRAQRVERWLAVEREKEPEVYSLRGQNADLRHTITEQSSRIAELEKALLEALSEWEDWVYDQLEGSRGWIGNGDKQIKRIAELRALASSDQGGEVIEMITSLRPPDNPV